MAKDKKKKKGKKDRRNPTVAVAMAAISSLTADIEAGINWEHVREHYATLQQALNEAQMEAVRLSNALDDYRALGLTFNRETPNFKPRLES